MTKTKFLRVSILMAAALAASGCSLFKKGSGPKTPVLGQRIPVLTSEGDAQVDLATAAMPMSLPPAVANSDWSQSGGDADKSMGHLALGTALQQAFLVQAGEGSSLTMRLASSPIVANGRVYTIDTLGAVRSFDARTGALYWASQTPNERGNERSLYGGGIAYDNGRIYATNGLGFVSALSEQTGGILWQVRPGGPLRGAPSIANGAIYVISQDNQIYSLDESNGARNWSEAASLEIAGVFGSASPAVGQGTVVAGFSSGELNAYRYENGRQVWQDALQRTSITTSVSSLSDVDADPVIDSGQVIAIGQGGRMVALELTTGQRQWELNIAGISTPWVAGDWIFAITDDAKLLCIYRQNGHIRWIQQLPQFQHAKAKKGQIDYLGPILAGDRLIVAGLNGTLINIDPATGNFQSQTNAGAAISVAPIVANSTLYVYDDAGRLHAYR
ncbi:MAG TPA: PQQ-binding-like beta-propeller repeat protein [Sphingomicrobium sp.]|nr:PQQ-binding-like beta-propeller repeat protein [Sphingomicrobium sp.]